MVGMPPRSLYEESKVYRTTPQSGNDCIKGVMMGFLMGSSVGVTLGAGFMALVLIPRGVRGKLLLTHMGKTALKMGLTFGSFMSIGGVLRCEDDDIIYNNNNNKNKIPSILEFNNNINNNYRNIC